MNSVLQRVLLDIFLPDSHNICDEVEHFTIRLLLRPFLTTFEFGNHFPDRTVLFGLCNVFEQLELHHQIDDSRVDFSQVLEGFMQ